MAGIPGALNAAGTGQEDNFYAYEETPVEYLFVTEKYFPASGKERFFNEANFIVRRQWTDIFSRRPKSSPVCDVVDVKGTSRAKRKPAHRRLLFPLLHEEKEIGNVVCAQANTA